MRKLSPDHGSLIMDFGTLSMDSDKVFFRSGDTGNVIPVEDMAQGAHGFIEDFLDQPTSIVYSEIVQQSEKTRMMLHEVVRHKEIEERAFGIFESLGNTDAEQNWFSAELELLQIQDAFDVAA